MRVITIFAVFCLLFNRPWQTKTTTGVAASAAQTGEDVFNYDQTDLKKNSYGPKEWGNVTCKNVATCPGWPTNWENHKPYLTYDGMQNQCLDCTRAQDLNATTGTYTKAELEHFRKCRQGKQSPIDLKRNVTLTSTCKDRHQMIIKNGNCIFGEMDFQVLPHVLRAYQPKRCDFAANVDFSMGFPVPWLLEFTDISVPSHHTQEGRRYDAEVVLSHTYTADGPDRLLSNVAVFLEEGNNDDHKDFLELYLREWGVTILRMRRACDLGIPVDKVDTWETMEAELDALFETITEAPSYSVAPSASPSASPSKSYEPISQPSDSNARRERELRRWRPTMAPSSHFPSLSPSVTARPSVSPAPSASPSLSTSPSLSPSISQAPSISAAPSVSSPPSASFMPSTSPSSGPTVAPEILDKKWYKGTWDPYHWVNMTGTEYYYRYEGSLVEPPCFIGVHWRVLRLPVKISPRQLHWLSELLKLRLNPNTCENDTFGKVVGPKVEVNRPEQVEQGAHQVVFCECINWNSTRLEDQEYCNMTMDERGVHWRTLYPSASPTATPSKSVAPSVSAPPSDVPSSVPSPNPSAAPSTTSRSPSTSPRSPPSTAPKQGTAAPAPGVDGVQGPTSSSVVPFIHMGITLYAVSLALVLHY